MKIDISQLEFEDVYESKLLGETTIYFIAPRELVANKHPEAESAEIMISFLTTEPFHYCPAIMLAPTKDGEDYDWEYIQIEDFEIVKKLIAMGLERAKTAQ